MFEVDIELNCIFGKPMKRRFQRCIVHTEKLSTFHARVEYISVKNYAIETIAPVMANNTKIYPFPWGTWTSMNAWADPTHHPKPLLHPFTHFNFPLVTMGRPQFTPKTASFPSMITTPSNTLIPRPTLLTIPNGIRIHSAVLPQYTFRTDTDRQTDTHIQSDRQMVYRRQVSTNTAYARGTAIERRANNVQLSIALFNSIRWPRNRSIDYSIISNH